MIIGNGPYFTNYTNVFNNYHLEQLHKELNYLENNFEGVQIGAMSMNERTGKEKHMKDIYEGYEIYPFMNNLEDET